MSISRNRCGARRSLDRLDQKLDVLVEPDGSWHWKDEDELDEAARLGLLDADAVRAEAKRVLKEWPFPTGCGGETAAKPNPRVCSPQSTRMGCTSARIGVEYAIALSTHCDVGRTYFDGRFWIIDRTQPYGGNRIEGARTLVTRDLALFGDEGLQFAFKPAPSSFVPPACY